MTQQTYLALFTLAHESINKNRHEQNGHILALSAILMIISGFY